MISQRSIQIVKSTAPVLAEHGETLTRHFYQRMFKANPEVAPYFNPANQAKGAQQRALANAICAYAAHIDNLEALKDAVEIIAHKHASLMIKPEHYPIVGENLLASIKEVMGDAATDDIIDAWAEAYGALADILIKREQAIYDENAARAGGWDGFREFVIDRKEPESEIITSFYLKPNDGGPLPVFSPGQYITVRMKTPNGSTTMRNYSLSDRPGLSHYRISVKRETGPGAQMPGGYVSTMLHDTLQPGDQIEVGPPCGEFVLDNGSQVERPLVLLAGGVGVTPLISMLTHTLENTPDRPVVFVHACLNEPMQAFKKTVEDLSARHANLTIHFRYSEPAQGEDQRAAHCSSGLVDEALLESLLPERQAEYYFCGPKPFMAAILSLLTKWGIPNQQIHFEFFGPRQELESMS